MMDCRQVDLPLELSARRMFNPGPKLSSVPHLGPDVRTFKTSFLIFSTYALHVNKSFTDF